ncbi:MAG: hypothetical protein QM788_03830 [Roseateles sp.]|uniref:hypothetical protein n=1 Tax=Roseateles sp. TaxID=1971397 RepID=UPI0039EC9A4D
MPPATPSRPASPPAPAQARVLQGGSPARQGQAATTAATAKGVPARPPAPQPAAAPPQRLPGWARGVVIGGLLLAAGMPLTVLMSRSMLEQEALTDASNSQASMVCTSGSARAVDGSSLRGWLFGGSVFSCGAWETREARLQRERDQVHSNYMARQK